MAEDREWSHSFVTYHGGASYWLGGKCFLRNRRTQCSDPKMRKKLKRIKGMSIEDIFKDTVKAEKPVEKKKKKTKKLKKKKVARK